MPNRDSITERLLFDEQQLRILSEFDAYTQGQPNESVERNIINFRSLRGVELQFSDHALRRWLALRQRLR